MIIDFRKVLIALSLVSVGCANAQIRISLSSDRTAYLPYEPIMMTINIENNSGNTLTFPKRAKASDTVKVLKKFQSFIRCDIIDEQNHAIIESNTSKRIFGEENINLADELILPSGGNRKLTVELDRYYKMTRPQKYVVKVHFRHKRLGQDFISPPITVSVVPGVPKLTRFVGVPLKYGQEKQVIKERKCELLNFHGKRHTEYVLRISDEKFIHCTRRLSKHISGDNPDMRIDARSQIHIIVQTHPKTFTYWLFNIDGTLKQSALYRYNKKVGVPRLFRDPDIGRVMIVGGIRYIPEEDEEIDLPSYEGDKTETQK